MNTQYTVMTMINLDGTACAQACYSVTRRLETWRTPSFMEIKLLSCRPLHKPLVRQTKNIRAARAARHKANFFEVSFAEQEGTREVLHNLLQPIPTKVLAQAQPCSYTAISCGKLK